MQNSIPIPTDNVYKFYALFGLLIFIFSFASTIYLNDVTNALMFDSKLQYEEIGLHAEQSDLDRARKEVIERRIEIARENKKFYLHGLGVVAGVGVYLMGYGFMKWHREIQPIQDQMAKLQLEKLRIEVATLKKETEVSIEDPLGERIPT